MSSEEIGDAQHQAQYKRVSDWSCDEVVTWIKGNYTVEPRGLSERS